MDIKPSHLLYQIISASFCVIVVISQIIAAKIVHIPFLADFGGIPAGLLTYPLTFFLSDLVTEIFGARKARIMVYTALGMTLLSYALIKITLMLPTQDHATQNAFQLILGLNGLI